MVRRNSEVVKTNRIAGLTVKPDALAPCAEKMSDWTKLSLAVDSGACESVIDAAEQVPGYEVQETRVSKFGLVYASATDEWVSRLLGLDHLVVQWDARVGGICTWHEHALPPQNR